MMGRRFQASNVAIAKPRVASISSVSSLAYKSNLASIITSVDLARPISCSIAGLNIKTYSSWNFCRFMRLMMIVLRKMFSSAWRSTRLFGSSYSHKIILALCWIALSISKIIKQAYLSKFACVSLTVIIGREAIFIVL